MRKKLEEEIVKQPGQLRTPLNRRLRLPMLRATQQSQCTGWNMPPYLPS